MAKVAATEEDMNNALEQVSEELMNLTSQEFVKELEKYKDYPISKLLLHTQQE